MRAKNSGMTLIELMAVVAIVGILAAIAYPSYRKSVLKSGRSEAKIALSQAAQELEKCFTMYHSYDYNLASSPCKMAQTLEGAGFGSPNGKYVVTKVDGATPLVTYLLTATPQGAQTNDTDCGSFTLTESNGPGVTGTSSSTTCWR